MGTYKRVARRCMGQDCQAFQGCRCPGCHFYRREDEVPPPPDKIVMAGGIAK
jgi:hypothetical protein